MIKKLNSHISDYRRNLSLFSTNARLFLIGNFFFGLGFSIYQLLLNLYFKEMGFSESLIGQVLSAISLGMMLICVPAAMAIQKISIKRILVGSTLLAGLFYFLQAIITGKQMLLLVSFMVGVTMSFSRVAIAPFLMRNSTPEERTHLFSLNFGTTLLAGTIGSLGGGYLTSLWSKISGSQVLGFRYALFSGVFLGLLGIIPFSLIKKTDRDQLSTTNGFDLNRNLLRERGNVLLKLLLPYFILGLGAGLVIPFLNLYFRDRFNLSAGTIGIYFSLLQFVMLTGILIGPILSRKSGMIKTIVYTQLASIPFMLILAFTFNNTLAVLAFLLRGSLMNMSQPISTNFTMEKVKEDEQPLTNSLMMLAWTSSWAIVASLGGNLISRHGFTLPLLIAVVLYVISSLLYLKFFSGKEDIKMGKITTILRQA
ncbi:MAG TPA: MFS transporter [candidate division Zixibacteria bacterium]